LDFSTYRSRVRKHDDLCKDELNSLQSSTTLLLAKLNSLNNGGFPRFDVDRSNGMLCGPFGGLAPQTKPQTPQIEI